MIGGVDMYLKAGLPSEKLLVQVWKGRHLRQGGLITDDGPVVEVVFPGWQNTDRGPDFRGAIVATGAGKLLKGDVEMHVLSSDWVAHGHDRDPLYDAVAAHVVWRIDNPGPTRVAKGALVPTLALEGSADLEAAMLGKPAQGANASLCLRREALSSREKAAVLDEAGEQRFEEKAAALESNIAVKGAEQALYEGLMEALGYSKNKGPFVELSQIMPLAILEGLVAGKPPQRRVLTLQAVLFGSAGLLPSQRGIAHVSEPDVHALEEIWASAGPGRHMPEGSWQLFRVRPQNMPTRRIAAASHLLERYAGAGVIEGLAAPLMQGPPRLAAREVRRALTVKAQGFWADNADFGAPCRRDPTLVGDGRAGEMAVNVVLPFFRAYGCYMGIERLARRALEVHMAFPKLPENHITLQMKAQLFLDGSRLVNSAMRQQGLIHVYKSMCQQLQCGGCVLG